jgi:hypothetical protein
MNKNLNSGEQFHKLETLTLGDDHRGSKTFKHASVVLGVLVRRRPLLFMTQSTTKFRKTD